MVTVSMSNDPRSSEGVTTLLMELDAGRDGAFAELVERVYSQLHGIAIKRMRNRFGPDIDQLTLPPTAIVNDVVVQLMKQRKPYENTEHFFAIATRLMMRLLCDYQRRRNAKKYGGGVVKVEYDENRDSPELEDSDAHCSDAELTLRAISELHELNPRKAEVVTLHVICGLPLSQVAEHIKVSLPTVERDWRFAKHWLSRELSERRQK